MYRHPQLTPSSSRNQRPPNPYSIWSDPETQEHLECPCHCPSYVIEHIWDWCNDRPDILEAAKALHGEMYIPTKATELVNSPIISTTIKFVVGHGLYLAVQMWKYSEDRDGTGRVETLGASWKLHEDSKPSSMALQLPGILRSFQFLTVDMLRYTKGRDGGLYSVLIPFVDIRGMFPAESPLQPTAGFAMVLPLGAKALYFQGMVDILEGVRRSAHYLHAILPGSEGLALLTSLPFVAGAFPHGVHYVAHNAHAHHDHSMAVHQSLHPGVLEPPYSPDQVDTVVPASCGEPSNMILRNPGRVYHFDTPETAVRHARTAKWIEKNVVEQLNDAPISTRTRR